MRVKRLHDACVAGGIVTPDCSAVDTVHNQAVALRSYLERASGG